MPGCIGGDATRDRGHDGLLSLVSGVVLPTRVVDCAGFPIAQGFLLKRRISADGQFSYRLSDDFEKEVREG
jgi:hypothetical protein